MPPLGMVDGVLTITKCSEQAIAMNLAEKSFIESKKLILKQSKCCVIHVGRKSNCNELKVHEEKYITGTVLCMRFIIVLQSNIATKTSPASAVYT